VLKEIPVAPVRHLQVPVVWPLLSMITALAEVAAQLLKQVAMSISAPEAITCSEVVLAAVPNCQRTLSLSEPR